MPAAASGTGLAEALQRIARERDPRAWSVVVDRLGPDLRRVARALTGDDALADDAVQNALLQVRDDACQFAPRGDDVDGDARRWIMRVGSNSALQALRRRRRAERRDHAFAAQHAASTVPSPDQAVMERERADRLRQALADLPAEAREPIVMRHLHGLGFDAIARELGIPVGTAKTRVHRGLERLRERLDREGAALSIASLACALRALDPAAPGPTLAAGKVAGQVRTVRRAAHASTGGKPVALIAMAAAAALVVGALAIGSGHMETAAAGAADQVSAGASGSDADAAHGAPASAADRPAAAASDHPQNAKKTLVRIRASF
jgi:RNA polymerase sigma-70 factor (ECF subfamily)